MKTAFFLLFACLLSGSDLFSQLHYIQAGNQNVVVQSDGSVGLSEQYATRFTVQDCGNRNFKIVEQSSLRQLEYTMNDFHRIHLTWTGAAGSDFRFSQDAAFGGWLISRTFGDGYNYFLVLADGQLTWRSEYRAAGVVPAIFFAEKTGGNSTTNNQQNADSETRKPQVRSQVGGGTASVYDKLRKKHRAENEPKKKNGEEGRRPQPSRSEPKKSYGSLLVNFDGNSPCSPYDLTITVRGDDGYSKTLQYKPQGKSYDFGQVPVGQYQVSFWCACGKCDMALPPPKFVRVEYRETASVRFNF